MVEHSHDDQLVVSGAVVQRVRESTQHNTPTSFLDLGKPCRMPTSRLKRGFEGAHEFLAQSRRALRTNLGRQATRRARQA